jgi:hypothetical protein
VPHSQPAGAGSSVLVISVAWDNIIHNAYRVDIAHIKMSLIVCLELEDMECAIEVRYRTSPLEWTV